MTGGGERNVISLLREQLKSVNDLLEGTVADVTPKQAHGIPPGVASFYSLSFITRKASR